MKGIILAAGRGSRLGNHTDQKPKCLVEFHGRPLLEWQMESLRQGGVTDILIVGGYKHECLKTYESLIIPNKRWASSNMVVSLLCASPVLSNSTAIISYSDIFYPESLVMSLSRTSGDIVIAQDPNWYDLWEKRFKNPLEDAETFKTDNLGCVVEIGNRSKNIQNIEGQFMGLFKITPKGWNHIQNYLKSLSQAHIDRLDVTSLLSALIKNGCNIHSVPCCGEWGEVDHASDIELYERIFPNYGERKTS